MSKGLTKQQRKGIMVMDNCKSYKEDKDMTELKLKFKKGFAKRAFAVAMALCLVAPLMPSVASVSNASGAVGRSGGNSGGPTDPGNSGGPTDPGNSGGPTGPGNSGGPTDPVKVDSVKVAVDKVTLYSLGETANVTATVTPADAENKAVKWASSNNAVATVDQNGKVTAKGNGTAVVTATAQDGSAKSGSVTIAVKQKAHKVVLSLKGQNLKNKAALKATYKKSYTFKATVTDAGGSKVTSGNEKITWKSSNKKIATVKSNGKVTAKKKAGTVTITAKTADGKSASVKLKVSKKAVKVTKVKVTGSKKMNLKTKKTQTLKATVTPVTAANQKVTWKSSNKKIATVSSKGKVKVKKAGKVKITATAKDGSKKKATITITVKKK